MNGPRSVPPARVPTLTEVVRLPEAAPAETPPPAVPAEAAPPFVERRAEPPLGEDQVVQRVLADLQRQIDLMLEVRVREVLAPVLARTADALVRDARAELASTLRDVVARAVSQEMSRHRNR